VLRAWEVGLVAGLVATAGVVMAGSGLASEEVAGSDSCA